jgi:hypothetical protein
MRMGRSKPGEFDYRTASSERLSPESSLETSAQINEQKRTADEGPKAFGSYKPGTHPDGHARALHVASAQLFLRGSAAVLWKRR